MTTPLSLTKLPLRPAEIAAGFTVHRALPQRALRRVGAWVFLDHAGPVSQSQQRLDVAPHPHIGLQTFTWMIQGEIVHRDSLGYEQVIRANEVNLMTAGKGITHSETATSGSSVLHTAQLWIALPKQYKSVAPHFEHYPDLPLVSSANGIKQRVLMGQHAGVASPVPSYSPLVAIDIQNTASQPATIHLPLRAGFEYGVLALTGQCRVGDHVLTSKDFAYQPVLNKAVSLALEVTPSSQVLLIGGEPFADKIALWWNFVVHSQAELEQAYYDWQADTGRFAAVEGYVGERTEAPDFANQRVRFS